MRTLIHKVHDLWCVVTGRCPAPVWTLDDLKHDDPVFASHMDWMQQREHEARPGSHRRNPIERTILGQERDS